jgi:hypothetical protein
MTSRQMVCHLDGEGIPNPRTIPFLPAISPGMSRLLYRAKTHISRVSLFVNLTRINGEHANCGTNRVILMPSFDIVRQSEQEER